MYHKEKIIVIAGGSFQGKSLIALEMAHRFNFSGVLTTDTIRNILKITHPEKFYLSTSTYLLSEVVLTQQCFDVSNIIFDIIPIYESRGENMVIEGMHFNKEIIDYFASRAYCNIFIDNLMPFNERVLNKQITRSNLRMRDPKYKNVSQLLGPEDVKLTLYMSYQERIDQIHNELRQLCIMAGFHVVTFDDIASGKNKAAEIINTWMNNFDQ
jgi:2-phosphoglycerate kinase